MFRLFFILILIGLNLAPVLADENEVQVKETYKLNGQIEYDDNPVETIYLDEDIEKLGFEATSGGRGGMKTKLQAAKVMTRSGGACIISNGKIEKILTICVDGLNCKSYELPFFCFSV